MKLDPRIIGGKRPLTAFDTEEANEFIGKEGYFADCLAAFTNVRRYEKKWMLKAINEKAQRCFKDADGVYWDYFLPAEWVQEPEPKWRAFKDHAEYKEFLNNGIIESWVKIKDKSTDKIYELMYVGGGDDKICLGGMMFLVSTLFNTFELFNESTGQWQPFGVNE